MFFLQWLESHPGSLSAEAKCSLPIELADVQLKNLDRRSLEDCFGGKGGRSTGSSSVQLTPGADHQIVFEGDSLQLSCRAEASNSEKVWDVSFSLLKRNSLSLKKVTPALYASTTSTL